MIIFLHLKDQNLNINVKGYNTCRDIIMKH